MKKVVAIIALMFVTMTSYAFDIELDPVVVNTTTSETAVPVNVCNFNSDSLMVACPMIEINGYPEYLLTDVKMRYAGTEDNKLAFSVVNGVVVHESTIEDYGVDMENCYAHANANAIVCDELKIIDSFGTLNETSLGNTYFKYDENSGKYLLINLDL